LPPGSTTVEQVSRLAVGVEASPPVITHPLPWAVACVPHNSMA